MPASKTCERCIRECKQPPSAVLVSCPLYKPIARDPAKVVNTLRRRLGRVNRRT